MRPFSFPAGSVRLLLLLIGFLGLFASGLAPAGAQEDVPPPEVTPDAATGLEIYSDRCASCHGETGLGDGELADRSAVPPTALASTTFLRRAVPAEMFNIITHGITGEQGLVMPPFGPASSNPISETDRWHLITAIYSLGTAAGQVENGREAYTTTCAACHGDEGTEAFDLTSHDYWQDRSNTDVFNVLAGDTIPEHNFELDEETLWAIVDYARTFSYEFVDVSAAATPISEGNISGTVLNATTNQVLAEPLEVQLNAFTPEFQVVLTETATLDEGAFAFVVNEVNPDLVYIVTLAYNGIQFGSDFGELARDEPTLSLPVTVYETTADPAGILIDQMHIILEFEEGQVSVNELYQFSNTSNAVYVGEAGDAAQGTVEVALPAGAQNPQFTRTFGSLENFFPADDLLPTAGGWSEVTPVRPGQSTLNLLVRYTLPYENDLTIAHPVHYPVTAANLVLSDVGVALEDDRGEWLASGTQDLSGEPFLTFSRTGLNAGETLQLPLSGRPRPLNVAPIAADQTTQQLASLGLLLIVAAGSAYYVYTTRQRQQLSLEPAGEGPALSPDGQEDGRRTTLLQAIAALDQAYEQGELDEGAYQQRRQQLKEQLMSIWKSHV